VARPAIVVLFGVAGSGKTTVGRLLARALGFPFHEGDDHHTAESVAKMSRGVPLDDEDRKPWLARLRRVALEAASRGEGAVIACSALKRSYRRYLGWGVRGIRFVHLRGSPELLRERLAARAGHYMKPGMLESQLDTLEEPGPEAIRVDIGPDPAQIVTSILRMLTSS
jgi:gluconokinase